MEPLHQVMKQHLDAPTTERSDPQHPAKEGSDRMKPMSTPTTTTLPQGHDLSREVFMATIEEPPITEDSGSFNGETPGACSAHLAHNADKDRQRKQCIEEAARA